MMDYDNMICKKYTLTNVRFAHTFIPETAIFVPQRKKAVGLDPDKKLLVDTENLMELLDCGKPTAIRVGTEAKAKVVIGRKILWNLGVIRHHLNSIAE